MIQIQPFREQHWPATWQILEPVFRAGETYAFSPDISEAQAHFEVIGTLPQAFRHARLGYVDALVMYKLLEQNEV